MGAADPGVVVCPGGQEVGDGGLGDQPATADEIGEAARVRGLGLLELSPQQMSLEQRYMELTRDTTDYHADPMPTPAAH